MHLVQLMYSYLEHPRDSPSHTGRMADSGPPPSTGRPPGHTSTQPQTKHSLIKPL